MEKEAKQTTNFYRLVAWAHANRKRLILVSALVLVAGAGIGIYNWNKSAHEAQANDALSKINPPYRGEESVNAAAAEPYLKVADDYPGTGAAARALLIGGGILFEAGKFPEAQHRFEQFLAEYSDYPVADQALLGVDACYEAEGKWSDAATRYKDFIDRHAGSPSLPQVKSALARAYLAQDKPDLALQLYEDLERSRNPDSWTAEAGIQKEELLTKYPKLRKQPLPASAPPAAPLTTLPSKLPATLPTTPTPTASTNLTAQPAKPAKP